MSRAPTLGRVVRKMIDSMELLWDTKIIAYNKNTKGIVEGKYPTLSPSHIAHALMGSRLMYFIPHKCFPIPKWIELVKGAFDPTTKVAKDLQGNAILSLDPSSIANAFSLSTPMSTPVSIN